MNFFGRFFKGKASSAPQASTAPPPENATSRHPCRMQQAGCSAPHPKNATSRHPCMLRQAGCSAPATWRNRAGQYFCDEHKEVMDVMLRLNHHVPGWERL